MPIKVAIVEDSREVREGLAYLLNASRDYECVAAFSNGEEAIRHASLLESCIVLMDIGLPGISGIDCIRQLKLQLQNVEIMVLTVFEDDEKIFASIESGATGYLVKSTPPAKILEAITDLNNGGSPMSNQIARRVVESVKSKNDPPAPLGQLTDREQVVIENLARGYLYKEIADRLDISIHTVRSHVHNIYEKLHVSNRTEALRRIQKQ